MSAVLNRREFLRLGALAVGAAYASPLDLALPRQQTLERKGRAKKVVVVGAGLAGLSSAYELTQAGHDVTILEAQLRPGGRVLTLREPFSDGLYANAGAARIEDIHNYTLKYADLFGLTVNDFYPKELSEVWYFRGTRLKVKHGEAVDLSRFNYPLSDQEKQLGYHGLWKKYIPDSALEDIKHSNPTGPDWPPASLKHYDQLSLMDFLRSQGASPGAIEVIGGPAVASTLWALRGVAMTGGTKTLEIRGGMDLLPRAFASRLADRIRYGAPVVRIEQDAVGVRAVCLEAGTPQTIRGDYLICAIPFFTLRLVEVSPPFTPEKRRAIEEMPSEHLGRIFLQTRKRYWLEQGCNGFGTSDVLGDIWQPTLNQPGPRGILESYLSGNRARQFAAMTEGQRIENALNEMDHVLPGVRENFEGAACKFWDEDPWARGAVAMFYPGQLSEFGPHLARAEGRTHFAGEHTSAWNGWMQGALESGNRAAREVNEAA